MHLLYNIGIAFLGLGIRLFSLFNNKARLWIKGRQHLFENLPDFSGKKVYWFHCASLGEFDQGIPLMQLIKKNEPDVFLVVTFFSPSGMQHYFKRNHHADYVCYVPLDTPGNAKMFIEKLQPHSVFFIKYEFWGNLILNAKKSGAKIYNVSGLFRSSHRFFKWYGGFFRKILQQFDYFYVQNASSKALLEGIQINNVLVTGDSRFDKVIQNKEKAVSNSFIDQFCKGEQVFIVGSSWPQDEAVLIPVINKMSGKVIIAPHNVDDKHVKGITDLLTRPYSRYTKDEVDQECEVLIIDTIGQLSNAYSYGAYAYVGGGFSGSLHNILEPAVFGMGVIFGPKHHRFPEGEQFIEEGIGFSINTQEQLEQKLNFIRENKITIDKKAADFVSRNVGASQRIFNHIHGK